jgi:hypothetical protein
MILLSSILLAASLPQSSGSYQVPSNPEITLAVTSFGIVESKTAALLDFQLPEDLVGSAGWTVQLRETAPDNTDPKGARVFEGLAARAVCTTGAHNWNCAIKYSTAYGAYLNSAATSEFLQNKYANDPAMLSSRLALAAQFASDPEGILNLSF